MGALPHMAVNRGRIGPVGLDRHDRKAVTFDQVTSNGGAGTIEFGSTVRSLTEQNDARASEAIEGRAKGGVVQRRQGVRRQLSLRLPKAQSAARQQESSKISQGAGPEQIDRPHVSVPRPKLSGSNQIRARRLAQRSPRRQFRKLRSTGT